MDKTSAHMTLLAVMILVACLSGIASDIYAPSLTMIAGDLVAAVEQAQRSMAIFMLGVSISQLIYGPLSEGLGRKIPLMIGLVIFIAGSIISFQAMSITTLIVSRFVQGAGAGACACLWRSIFRDSFSSIEIAKYGAYIGIVMTFVVAGAPAVGGYLQEYFGWRSNFLFLAVYSLLTLIMVIFFLKETSIHHHKNNLNRKFFFNAVKQLIQSRIFIGYTLCIFMTYGAFFSWFVVGPVLLIQDLKIDPIIFGWINLGLGGSAMTLAGLVNARLVPKKGGPFMLRLGWNIMMGAGALLILLNVLLGLNIMAILLPMFMFLFGGTLIWPNAFAGAFAPFGKIAGYAGALYSFMQLGGGAVLGWLSSFLPTTSPIPLAIVFLVMACCARGIFETVVVKE